MARHWFGGGLSDWTFNVDGGGTPTLTPSVPLTMWSASTGGTQYTDLLNSGGGAITSVTSGDGSTAATGQIPRFQGPNNVVVMYADAGGGQRLVLTATDIGDVTSALETRIAALEAAKPRFAVKPSAQSVTSSTTFVDDTDLVFTGVPAGITYELTGSLVYSAHQDADIKFTLVIPANGFAIFTSRGQVTSATGNTNAVYLETIAAGATFTHGGVTTNNTAFMSAMVRGILYSGDGGTVQLRWAQNASSATASIVRGTSHLKLNPTA